MAAVGRQRNSRRRDDNEIEFSRIVAFSDGVFAIAITLLVLNITIDTELPGDRLGQEIWDQREAFLAYGISFAVTGRFWLIHHRFFGEVTAFDTRLLTINMIYLACIVLIPFSSEVLGEYADQPVAVVVYAVNLIACVATAQWMAIDAYRAGMTRIDPITHREGIIAAAYVIVVFVVSIPLAFLVPGLAPVIWLAFFFDPGARYGARVRAATSAGGEGARGGISAARDDEGD